MRNRKKDQSVEEEHLGGELITGPREYFLKKPIIQAGVERKEGEPVKLNDRQAEGLKGSGHI